jgi:hypothetical protein
LDITRDYSPDPDPEGNAKEEEKAEDKENPPRENVGLYPRRFMCELSPLK